MDTADPACVTPSRRDVRHRTYCPTQPGTVFRLDGEIDGIMAFRVENDRINGLYFVRNPQPPTEMS